MIALLKRWLALPWGRASAAAALIALIALFFICTSAIGLRWDPFDLQGRRLARAEAQADRAASNAAARAEEAAGERAQTTRILTHDRAVRAADQATAAAVHHARTADDASTPLDPNRLDRLRAHDGELCRIAGRLDGCAAKADAPRGGDDPVRPGRPAARRR